jgi:ACS family allantoate permease-like MFS transporter
VLYFVVIGLVTSRWKNLRTYFMMFSIIPPFIGFLMMSLLSDAPSLKWAKWGGYFITVPFVIALFLAWTLIPSNTAGRTKRTLMSSFTFVGYCVGNMTGSQIFKSKDAVSIDSIHARSVVAQVLTTLQPRYIPGTIGCAVCFGLEFFLIVTWRLVLCYRNKRQDKMMQEQGITEEERIQRGKELGEQDVTDLKNPYVGYLSAIKPHSS